MLLPLRSPRTATDPPRSGVTPGGYSRSDPVNLPGDTSIRCAMNALVPTLLQVLGGITTVPSHRPSTLAPLLPPLARDGRVSRTSEAIAVGSSSLPHDNVNASANPRLT